MLLLEYSRLIQDVGLCVRNYDLLLSEARSQPEVAEALERIVTASRLLERTSYTRILYDLVHRYTKPRNVKKGSIASMFHACVQEESEEGQNVHCLGDFGKRGEVPSRGCSLWTRNTEGEIEVFVYMDTKFAYVYFAESGEGLYEDEILALSSFGTRKVQLAHIHEGRTTVTGKAVSVGNVRCRGSRTGSSESGGDGEFLFVLIFILLMLALIIYLRQ